MIPNTSFAVANVQVSRLPIICKQIEGYFNGGAGAYLQVFDSCTTPAAGAVPKWQMPLNATAQFQETLQVDELVLSEGLFVGVSSTDGTWTASASTMDVTVWTNDPVVAVTLVGDKTTGVNTLYAWTNNPTKKLLGVLINNNIGNTAYLYISGFANGGLINYPPGQTLTLPVGFSRFYFAGMVPFTQQPLGTFPNDCFLVCSNVAGTAIGNAISSSGTGFTILAITN